MQPLGNKGKFPSTGEPNFEFRNGSAARIFDHLTKEFDQDYMVKRFARDDSGWRTLGDIADGMKISTSIVYSKTKNQFSPPIQELLQRGLIERRFFQKERGRGGEVMRFRIAYDNELVRNYIDRKIRRGELSITNSAVSETVAPAEKLSDDLAERSKRIAVLPFANFSPNPADEYFSDGLTEEMIATVSKITGLTVISRTSVMRYKQTEQSLSEIAGELKVNVVLEGSVRKMGNDLRITAQLIDVQNDKHLWSEDYDRKFENIFSIQKEIALRVADSLQVTILSKESKELGKKPTQSMEAYILYLKGRAYPHRYTLDSFKRKIDYWEQAIKKDPNYAEAYAAIASAYSTAGSDELLPSNEAFSKARRFAEKAMQLDPAIPESHTALGWVLLNQKWDFLGAEKELRRAVELSPNLVGGRLSLASLLKNLGRSEEAAIEGKRALELDPMSTSTCASAGNVFSATHHFDEAIEALRNALEMGPNSAIVHDNLGTAYVGKGMIEEGIAEIKKAIEISEGKFSNWISDLAWAHAKAGNIEEAKSILADLLRINEQSHKSETEIAGVYLSLGEKDKAMEWLEKAYDRHAGYLLAINYDCSFDDFRSDPRFRALLKKIGFPDTG